MIWSPDKRENRQCWLVEEEGQMIFGSTLMDVQMAAKIYCLPEVEFVEVVLTYITT